jgi:hypothetical protein
MATARRRRGTRASLAEDERVVVSLIALGLAAALCAVGVPVGVAVLCGAVVMAGLWTRGHRTEPGSNDQKVAEFMGRLRRNLMLPGWKVVGFGPTATSVPPVPGEKSHLPALRLAAMWAALAGAGLAGAQLCAQRLVPIRLPMRFPGLSALGCYVLVQALAAAARDGSGGRPAAVLEQRTLLGTLRAVGLAAAAVGALVGSGVAVGLVIGTRRAPVLGRLGLSTLGVCAAGAAVGVAVALAVVSVRYARDYVAPWRERNDKAATWAGHWGLVTPKTTPAPIFYQEEAIGDPPVVAAASFGIPPGGSLAAYRALEDKIATALGTELVVITAPARLDGEGRPLGGSVQPGQMVVQYAVGLFGARPLLDHVLVHGDQSIYAFVVRAVVAKALEALRLGTSSLVALDVLTTQQSKGLVVETAWRLAPGVTADVVMDAAAGLAEKTAVPWLRVGRRTRDDGGGRQVPSEFVSILYGERLEEVEFADSAPECELALFLTRLDWDHTFRACRLVSPAGDTPMLLASGALATGVTELEFATPPGLALESVVGAIGKLRASAGKHYVDVQRSAPDRVRLLVGDADPLEQVYRFVDFEGEILHSPRPGRPTVRWAPGAGVDGRLLWDDFDSEAPHLLIAGASNMGKSSLISSLVLQLAFRNDANDLHLWLVDPKTELQPFEGLAHVRCMLDQHTSDRDVALAALLERLNRETGVTGCSPSTRRARRRSARRATRASTSPTSCASSTRPPSSSPPRPPASNRRRRPTGRSCTTSPSWPRRAARRASTSCSRRSTRPRRRCHGASRRTAGGWASRHRTRWPHG